jgi:hypothetical protein
MEKGTLIMEQVKTSFILNLKQEEVDKIMNELRSLYDGVTKVQDKKPIEVSWSHSWGLSVDYAPKVHDPNITFRTIDGQVKTCWRNLGVGDPILQRLLSSRFWTHPETKDLIREFTPIRKYLAKCNIQFRFMGQFGTPSFYLTLKSKLTIEVLEKLYYLQEKYGIRITRKNWELPDHASSRNYRIFQIGQSLRRLTPFCKKANHCVATVEVEIGSDGHNETNSE